jgi:hypothetical protein
MESGRTNHPGNIPLPFHYPRPQPSTIPNLKVHISCIPFPKLVHFYPGTTLCWTLCEMLLSWCKELYVTLWGVCGCGSRWWRDELVTVLELPEAADQFNCIRI